MKTKTLQNHVNKILNSDALTLSEINALKNFLAKNQVRRGGSESTWNFLTQFVFDFHDNFRTYRAMAGGEVDLIHDFGEFELELILFRQPKKITPEQKATGFKYLKNYFFTKKGALRLHAKGLCEYLNNPSQFLEVIVENANDFEFVGVLLDNWAALPVYKIKSPKGSAFYCPAHWAHPIFLKIEQPSTVGGSQCAE